MSLTDLKKEFPPLDYIAEATAWYFMGKLHLVNLVWNPESEYGHLHDVTFLVKVLERVLEANEVKVYNTFAQAKADSLGQTASRYMSKATSDIMSTFTYTTMLCYQTILNSYTFGSAHKHSGLFNLRDFAFWTLKRLDPKSEDADIREIIKDIDEGILNDE